jgi:thioesterase domain-containing protein
MMPPELEQFLHEHIPLSRAMHVAVVASDANGVTLQAPLAPNINHRDTVFGGSASALAILAAWSLLQVRMMAAGLSPRLVIQRNTMDYEQPIPGTFVARSALAEPGHWTQFTHMYERKGKARIAVNAVLSFEGEVAGHFNGEFVAIDPRRS